VLRRLLVLTCLSVLCACAAPRPRAVAVAPPPPALVPPPPPTPANGLWAILDPGCAKPNVANIHAWPSCASPFWISGDQALVILSGQFGGRWGLHDVSYAAKLNLTPGDPVIARVGTEKDGARRPRAEAEPQRMRQGRSGRRATCCRSRAPGSRHAHPGELDRRRRPGRTLGLKSGPDLYRDSSEANPHVRRVADRSRCGTGCGRRRPHHQPARRARC
jgi:hypothetical protein